MLKIYEPACNTNFKIEIAKDVIAEGLDAKVYNCASPRMRDKYIIKQIRMKNKNKYLNTLLNIAYKNVEQMIFFYEVNPYLFICSERLVKTLYDSELTGAADIIKMGLDVICGLDFLHSTLQLFHCDLKENNIMVDNNGVFKIIDFNNVLSRADIGNYNVCITSCKKSLRLWKDCRDLEAHVDIWAVGAICFNMYFKVELASLYENYESIRDRDHISPYVVRDLEKFFNTKF